MAGDPHTVNTSKGLEMTSARRDLQRWVEPSTVGSDSIANQSSRSLRLVSGWDHRKETEHEDPEEEEDDRVNGDLEGEHGDRPASLQRHHLMGQGWEITMQAPLQARRLAWIETFRRRSRVDLLSFWHRQGDRQQRAVVQEPWGATNRPDWAERGLLIWPRGGVWLQIEQTITCLSTGALVQTAVSDCN